MSTWAPNDLVSDVDLLAYEAGITTRFGQFEWGVRRSKALEDWLLPILRASGFEPQRLRTRYVADAVCGYTAGGWTDYTGAAASRGGDDLPIASILATPATDALYIGSREPFRGISVRMLDAVSSAEAASEIALWCDAWVPVGTANGSIRVPKKTLSGGGALTWTVPSDWVERSLQDSPYLYWARLTTSAVPTGAAVSQVGVIRRSYLCAPATLRTLMLIMREAPTGQAGPWTEKAEYYESEADKALQRALGLIGGEFDTDPVDDVVDGREAVQTAASVSGGGWTLERG